MHVLWSYSALPLFTDAVLLEDSALWEASGNFVLCKAYEPCAMVHQGIVLFAYITSLTVDQTHTHCSPEHVCAA